MGNFKPVPLDQIPIPQAAPPTQYTPAKIDEPPSQQPPGAGSMGAGGKIADIASNFLTGWLKGKQQAEQKKLAMAQQNVEGSQYAFQIAQQNAAQVMNDPNATPQQKQQAEAARQQAWKGYLDIAEKYTQPDKATSGKGKGKDADNPIKQHLKAAFGAEDPHIFSQGAMALLRTTGPPPLPAKTSQDQLADLQLKGEKRLDAVMDNLIEARKTGDPQKIAAAEQAYNDAAGKIKSPKEKNDEALAQAAADERAGKPVNEATKKQLRAAGYDPAPIKQDTYQRQLSNGDMYIDFVDPETKEVTSVYAGESRVPPDQRAEANQIFKDNLKNYGELLRKAHPDWSEQELNGALAEAMGVGVLKMKGGAASAAGMTPIQSANEVSKAINQVVAKLSPEDQQKAKAVLMQRKGIAGGGPDGGWMFRDEFAQKGLWDKWIGKDTYYGMDERQATAFQNQIRGRVRDNLRQSLKLSHPKLTEQQLNDALDEMVGPAVPTKMGPTPDEGPTADEVSVVAPDGTVGGVKKSDVEEFLKNNPGYKQQ